MDDEARIRAALGVGYEAERFPDLAEAVKAALAHHARLRGDAHLEARIQTLLGTVRRLSSENVSLRRWRNDGA